MHSGNIIFDEVQEQRKKSRNHFRWKDSIHPTKPESPQFQPELERKFAVFRTYTSQTSHAVSTRNYGAISAAALPANSRAEKPKNQAGD